MKCLQLCVCMRVECSELPFPECSLIQTVHTHTVASFDDNQGLRIMRTILLYSMSDMPCWRRRALHHIAHCAQTITILSPA